jgi:serine/arginine repetitive matrix protein 2
MFQKGTPTTPAFFKQALNSAEILRHVDTLLQRDREAKDAIKDAKAKERGIVDDPPRKLLLVSPVLQVVNKEVARNRVLFLFSDLILVTKPVGSSESARLMDKQFVVKNIFDLKRCSAPNLAVGLSAAGAFGDVKRSPMLNNFIREFKVDPDHAIQELKQQTGVGVNDPAIIGHLLFKIHELDRTKLGDFLSRRSSKTILHAYIDKFGFSDVRIDYALRIFFLSFYISDQAEHQALENMLAGFASRWFAANDSTVAFDKEQCHHLVYAIVLLNASLHLGHLHQGLPAALADFVGMVRTNDQRYTIKEGLLEDIYEAIRQERLLGPKDFPGHRGLEVQVTGSISPMHFTFRVKSELIRVRIPQPDANFRVQLLGQGLLFDPPTLHFSKSNEATFRVTGTAIGMKSISYWRGGANAHIYSMPLASSLAVERKHMRNTIQIGFTPLDTTEKEAKQYVFSIEDTREYEHWLKVLRTQIDRAAAIALEIERPMTGGGHPNVVNGVSPRIWKAAEMVAAEVLRETLMGSETSSVCSRSGPY